MSRLITRYLAVRGQDYGTCEALRWAAMSIAPFVIARGEDEEDVMAEAIERAGHEDVRLHSYEVAS